MDAPPIRPKCKFTSFEVNLGANEVCLWVWEDALVDEVPYL